MKLLFVIQRYGEGFVGGAEKYVRAMTTGLAADGHEIAVFTSCATSYADWADEFEPGVEDDHGVTVHRHRVAEPRDNDRFIPLHLRTIDRSQIPTWPWAQMRWAEMMGPELQGASDDLARLAAEADLTIIVGYHYAQSLWLTRIAAAHGPTTVVPTAHPEGAFHVGWVGTMFQYADTTLCLAPEEADLVAAVHRPAVIDVVPCPVEPLPPPSNEAIARALAAHGVERGRYAIVVGRVDPAKGSDDAIHFTRAFRQRIDPDFKLVVVGPGVEGRSSGDGIVFTDFVDDETKDGLVAGSAALLQPSYMESFSYSLMEGWQLRRPALIQARSAVLAGHARRGGGGITYHDYADFEAALLMLQERPDIGEALGDAGAAYVADTFEWRRVADSFIDAARHASALGRARLHPESATHASEPV